MRAFARESAVSVQSRLASLCLVLAACSTTPAPANDTPTATPEPAESSTSEPARVPAVTEGVPGGVLDGLSPEQLARIDRIRERELAPLNDHPEFHAQLQAALGDETDPHVAYSIGFEFGANLTRQGFGWLDGEQLERWAALRLTMADRSEAVCAGMWTGQVDADYAQSLLDDAELTELMQLTAAAGIAQLEANGPPAPDQASLSQGVAALLDALDPVDRQRFQAVAAGDLTADVDRCFAMRVLIADLHVLPADARHRYLRALATSLSNS